MNLNIDLFKEPKPKGSAQCPTCGRFAKIIRMINDASGLSGAIVDCGKCGRGVA